MSEKYLYARGMIVLSDYREYMNFNLCRGKLSRFVRAAVVLAVVLAALCLLLFAVSLRSMLLVILAGSLLLCLGMFFYLLKRQVKTVCEKRKPFLYAMHEVQFGGNGMNYRVEYDARHNPAHLPDSEQAYLYKDFYRVYETGGFVYFYPTKKSAIILPKRNMNPEASIRLRALLQKQLGKKFVRCW